MLTLRPVARQQRCEAVVISSVHGISVVEGSNQQGQEEVRIPSLL